MIIFQNKIDEQFEFNKGKNLFYRGIVDSLCFSPETLKTIGAFDFIDSVADSTLIDYITNRAIQEFCKMNQYYSFDKQAHENLRLLYVSLFTNIKNHNATIESIAEKHYENLIKWLNEYFGAKCTMISEQSVQLISEQSVQLFDV